MDCEIIDDGKGRAVFYCNTLDVAFGPGMPNREWAQAFCDWLTNDPRTSDVEELCSLWAEFALGHFRCGECDKVVASPICLECSEKPVMVCQHCGKDPFPMEEKP